MGEPANALDPDVLATLRQLNQDGQPDVVHEVLTLFLVDAPGRIAAIVAAVDGCDGPALQRAAHALKGGAGTIGAWSLQGVCRTLEEMGMQRAFDGAAAAVGAVQREYQRLKDEIDQLL